MAGRLGAGLCLGEGGGTVEDLSGEDREADRGGLETDGDTKGSEGERENGGTGKEGGTPGAPVASKAVEEAPTPDKEEKLKESAAAPPRAWEPVMSGETKGE